MHQASTPTGLSRRVGRVAVLMVFEAGTLAVASAVHLSGQVHGRSITAQGGHLPPLVIGRWIPSSG